MGRCIGGIAAASLLMCCVNGSLELWVQTRIYVLCDVGGNLGTGHWSCQLESNLDSVP